MPRSYVLPNPFFDIRVGKIVPRPPLPSTAIAMTNTSRPSKRAASGEPRVRDAVEADAPSLMRIYNREVLETTATLDAEPRTLEQQTRWMAERSGGHVVIVLEIAGRVVGFASLSPFKERAAYRPTVENSIYIDADHQGQGLGRVLMHELIARARLHGFHSVIARIAGGNPASVALHESFGYQVVGVEREVGRKFGRWLDVTELQLML